MPYGRKAAQQRVSKVFTAIAPLGGLDDIDPIANMAEQFCISLINWFPGNAALTARQGYREWCINLAGGAVRTLSRYVDMTGVIKVLGATNTGIYDVSVSSTAPPLLKTTTDGYYKSTMFVNVAKQYLVMVNNNISSPGLLYDGAVFTEMVRKDATPTLPGEIGGVDPNLFCHVTPYKKRLWFVETNSMTAWYLPVDALGGTAVPFLLGGVFKRGGKLLYMIDWSVDGGDGVDNKLVFVSTMGEVAVYSGNDPANAATFTLEAVFFAAPPAGDRAVADFGGDVLMVTTSGLIPLTKVLMGLMSESPYEQAVSKRISRTLNALILSRRYLFNWEVLNIPTLQSIVVFVPPRGTEPPIQFVMNALTGAWTRYDLPVNCAVSILDNFYFGTVDGRVMKYGDEIYRDGDKLDGTKGLPIICSLFSAYSYMGDPPTLKHWKLIRPLFQSKQPPDYLVHLNTDFRTDALPGNPAPPLEDSIEPLWDQAIWDDAFWSSAFTTFAPWVGQDALGVCCALLMKVAINEPTTFVAMEYIYEPGGII